MTDIGFLTVQTRARKMQLSYLVSTAGHAQSQNEIYPHNVKTILQLIQEGELEFEDEKVVGFASISEETSHPWGCDRYSYPELSTLAKITTTRLMNLGVDTTSRNIIAIICPTSIEFLVTWIALMRMGYGVVFVAPQCSPSAVHHLLQSSSACRLIYHSKYADLAQGVSFIDPSMKLIELPDWPLSEATSIQVYPEVIKDPHSISHVFHTSGTSGTPKPIPYTHLESVSILPRRSLPSYLSPSPELDGPVPEAAAFTTTPLFHGGVSDLLRAWMARSMIYFYPTSDVPITSHNVVQAVEACRAPPDFLSSLQLNLGQLAERERRFQVTAFLSVPYILSILAEHSDGSGMRLLASMDLVSTGGAPLDTKTGNDMVAQGVKLVSRLGSSECGFLLSSQRDHLIEKDWDWLRNDSPYLDALVFEPVDENSNETFEMVVTTRWLSKTKSNRDDGSYATGDLYQRHPTKSNVWRYIGKGDDVIVMSNGEKAGPSSIEILLRSSPYVSDVLVIGSGRPNLGLLIFPKSGLSQNEILSKLDPLLLQANHSSPSYAQISRDMCVVVTASKAIPKSSKGTIQRGLAYEVFKDEIDKLYAGGYDKQVSLGILSMSEIELRLKDGIIQVMGKRKAVASLDRTTDLFSWGVDSLLAARIRSWIQRNLTGHKLLPNNIVFENPSIARLGQYVLDLQQGNVREDKNDDANRLMIEMVDKYGSFPPSDSKVQTLNKGHTGQTIVLTGGTGVLGAFLAYQLSSLPSNIVARVICLVRARDDASAQRRIDSNLRTRGLVVQPGRITSFATDLSQSNLGLKPNVYTSLVADVDVLVHAAWPVHFASSLVSFEENIKGTRNLIDLVNACKSPAKFYFCSSLASVLAQSAPTVFEIPSNDPSTASAIGYSRSKWVTERVCCLANETEGLRERIHILRVGQLCGDTTSGHWNEKEGWPLLIRTAQTTGCLPLLDEEPSWLPVDQAARAIVDVVIGQEEHAPLIYHIVHPSHLKWITVLDGLERSGMRFDRVEQQVWLQRVEDGAEDSDGNLIRQMLPLWKAAYGNDTVVPGKVIDTCNARNASQTLRGIQEIDAVHIGKMVEAWRRSGFLH